MRDFSFFISSISVMVALRMSPFLNKAPVKEYYSLTVQQQSSAGRWAGLLTTLSPLPNQYSAPTQRNVNFQTPSEKGSSPWHHPSRLSWPHHTGTESTVSRKKALTRVGDSHPQNTTTQHCLLGTRRCSEEPTPFPTLHCG